MWLNAFLILCLAAAGYGLTVFFETMPDYTTAAQTQPEGFTPDQPAPDFSFKTIGGSTHKLSDFKGKVILLNFWASWCGPCVQEFPALVGIAEKYKDKVVFLAVSEDLEITPVHMFLEKMQAQGVSTARPNILITREEGQDIAHKLYQTFRLPETYIIGPDLTIKGKLVGAEWKPATLHALIDSL